MEVEEYSEQTVELEDTLAQEAQQVLNPGSNEENEGQGDPVFAMGRSTYAAAAMMKLVLDQTTATLIEREVRALVPQNVSSETVGLLDLSARLIFASIPPLHEDDDEEVTEPVTNVY